MAPVLFWYLNQYMLLDDDNDHGNLRAGVTGSYMKCADVGW